MFYIYEWYIKETGEIIYVGKGSKKRYLCKQHNILFKEFIKKFNCESRIIEYFEKEEDAFKAEFDRIQELKRINQCVCNIYKGGFGGETKSWTQEKREWYSKHNVMKNQNQRERMSKNNPMKNKEYAMKSGKSHKRKVVINNKIYDGTVDASKELGVSTNTILNWCKRGYDTNGNKCRYYNEKQKEFNFKKANSKKVIIDNKVYNSVKEASKDLGVWSETLIRAIKNNKKCKGHICKYANQQPSTSLNDL